MNCLVVADDFTGANATGVLLQEEGFSTCVYTTNVINKINLLAYEAVVVSSNSRGLTPKEAYKTVYSIVDNFMDNKISLYSNRIDSTLRGNIGSETDAFLDVLGKEALAIVVPCFPSAKRVNVGGHLIVDSIPLNMTSVAQDPKVPIKTSKTIDIIQKHSKYRCAEILLNELEDSVENLSNKMCKYKEQGNRIIIIDACTYSDIEKIAEASILTKSKIVAVDPGVFTEVMASKIIDKEYEESHKILLSIGSVNPVTEKQFNILLNNENVNCVYIDVKKIILNSSSKKQEMDRVLSEILSTQDGFLVNCLVGSGIYPENRIDLNEYGKLRGLLAEELSNEINETIAALTKIVLDSDKNYKSIFVSGGDIAFKVCEHLNGIGMEPIKQVAPLAVLGKLISKDYSEFKIITKGGMVGNNNAILECVRALKEI